MEDFAIFFAVVAALFALAEIRGIKGELHWQRRKLNELDARLKSLQGGERPATAEAPSAHPAPSPAATSVEVPPPAAVEAAPPPPPPPPPPRPAFPPVVPPRAPRRSLEEALSERWLVWLGGIAMALGGAFLVKYSVEQGWFGPAARVAAGAILGIAAIVLGHRLAGKLPAGNLPLGGVDPSYVPPALVGAGLSMVFASIYAGYGLYHLMLAPTAFGLLALVAAAAALLSVRHGPFVALLGLLGGFAVPALVQTGHPNALGLFSYLAVLTAGAVALLRWQQWWWLAWVSLTGCLLWTLVWLVFEFHSGDELPVGVFLLVLFGLFAAFRTGIPWVASLAGRAEAPTVRRVVFTAAGVAAALSFWLVQAADESSAAVAVMFALDAAMLAFAFHDQEFDALPALGAGLSLLVLAAWDLPTAVASNFPHMYALPLPSEVGEFARTSAAVAGLFAFGGFALLWRAVRPWRWAALSAAVPVLVHAVAYWRLSAIGYQWQWTTGALAWATLLLAAAQRVARQRSIPGMEAALGAYAVGVIGAIALAATIALEEAWLTVALAATLPGIAWVEGRLGILGLRRAALCVAGVVLVRLVANPYVLDYPLGSPGLVNWLLYGYGLPALCFAVAAQLMRRRAEDLTTQVLEAGAILFALVLANLEIHQGLSRDGRPWGFDYGLMERALQTVVWLAASAGLFLLHRRSGRVVPYYAAWILLAFGGAQAVLMQALAGNPYLTGQAVGYRLFANVLLPAYALPAALLGAHAALAQAGSPRRQWCGVLALAFAFLWLTLEIRHAFAGVFLDGEVTSSAELYAYSLAWLGYAAMVLAAGVRWRVPGLRRWGLGVLVVVVAKVFLVDMAQLEGIWRALSFLGLGAALIAVGWVYRRFVRIAPDRGTSWGGSS